MINNTLASSRRRPFRLSVLAVGLCLSSAPAALATLTYSGSVRDLAGDPWPGSGILVIGHSGDASMLLNDHIDGNGITQVRCTKAYLAYGPGTRGSLTMRGPGCTFFASGVYIEPGNPGNYFGDLFLGEGVNSHGILTLSDGAQWINPDYQNHYIYLGRGVGSYGKMVLTDPGTKMHLSDWLIVGHLDGSRGRLLVENGAVCETTHIYLGYKPDAVGTAVVSGPGSTLRGSSTQTGRLGRGSLTVQDGGLAEVRSLTLGYATDSYGEVLVTGAGSRLESSYSAINIGLGAGSGTGPGEGVLRLARGGVLYTDEDLKVGYGGDIPKGTMVFTIGNDGIGTIIPGRAEIDGQVRLHIATLLMEVDAGVTLTLGQQFVLIDYLTLHASHTSHNRFQNAPEGAVIVTPNHHAFRINYATDLGAGDLAITATVVAPPTTDADTDNLLDAWEIRCFGATDDPRADPVLDPDGDGRDTACEHAAGTDPLDPGSRCVTEVTDTPVGAPWDLAYSPYDPAVTYTVERATELTGPWDPVAPTATAVDGDTVRFTLPASAAEHAFYHVRIER